MPKLKTNKGAAKRFKKTASGRVKRAKAFAGHILGKKSRKRKRNLRKGDYVFQGDMKRMSAMLPYN